VEINSYMEKLNKF